MLDRNVLKENEVFLVSDDLGDIAAHNTEGQGLYWRDTRFLSRYELRLAGVRPTLLSSAGEHNFMHNLQFANPALETHEGVLVPARSISVRRNRFVREGLHERIGFYNYNRFPVRLLVTITVGSDFRDMFDVRGYTARATHGTVEPPRHEADYLRLQYLGLDGLRRTTEIHFTPQPQAVALLDVDNPQDLQARTLPGISGRGDPRTEYPVVAPGAEARFDLLLAPRQPVSITVLVVPTIDDVRPNARPASPSLDAQFVLIRDSYRRWEDDSTSIVTDNEILNAVVERSLRDLRLLSDPDPRGYLPSAGIPWFSVPFGRDSLITSIQTLMLQPAIAYGTLRFLAERQGKAVDDFRDEEPGKILHEVRMGEVARLGQVPHTAYYGSVDATPLFLVAIGELLEWTDDLAFMRELHPSVEAALEWLDRYGDLDGDGYVEYASRSSSGIRNQGWKDSADAVAYRDGRAVDPPVALAEVQGYVYDARLKMARYFRRLGQTDRALQQEQRAAALKQRFLEDFWLPEERYFALALGPDKQPVGVISSNPGQCLWSGLLDGEPGRAVAERLLQDDIDCGWGLRTLSSREPGFNPMSYHNGSVWPHDNAIIAAGLKRLHRDDQAARLVGEVLEAAVRFPGYRLPELYCGFSRDRRYFSMPARYPVSCSPQAWAAGSVFMMLQTVLGLRVDAQACTITLRPYLPHWLNRIAVRRLQVAGRRVHLAVTRADDRVHVEILDSGGLDVIVEPPPESPRSR